MNLYKKRKVFYFILVNRTGSPTTITTKGGKRKKEYKNMTKICSISICGNLELSNITINS